jgi:hypothetical protein
MLESEKYWNNPFIYKYNVTYCTVSSWILVEHGDRERVNKRWVIWLKPRIYRPEVPRQDSLRLSIYTLKNEGQLDFLFQGWVPVGGEWV